MHTIIFHFYITCSDVYCNVNLKLVQSILMITHNTEDITIYYMLLIIPFPYWKAIPCSHWHQCYYISTPQQPLAGQTEQRLNARSYERSPASALWSAFTHTGKRICWNRKMPHDQTYARRINRKGNFKIAVLQVGFFRNQGGGPAWGMGVHLAPDSFLKSLTCAAPA